MTERLRTVKNRHDLSLADLAKRTHYSRASWQRWLNGERMITASALDSLARATGCEPEPLQELLRRAVAEGAGSGAGAAASAGAVDGAPTPQAASAAAAGPTAGAEPVPGLKAEPAAAADSGVGIGVEREAGPGAEAQVAFEPGADPQGGGPAVPGAAARGRARPVPLTLGVVLLLGVVALVVLVVHGPGGRAGAVGSVGRAATAPAALRPSCRAAGCYGQDPQAMCAGDARTIASAHIEKAIIWMRYSPTCQAAWAKITDAVPRDQAVITNNDDQSATALVHYGNDGYSPMVPAGSDSVLEVCGTQTDKAQACTPLIPDPAQAPLFATPGTGPTASSPPSAAGVTASK